eukprot:symbB.v1.2.028171.t1/scaffold2961.1/size66437/3
MEVPQFHKRLWRFYAPVLCVAVVCCAFGLVYVDALKAAVGSDTDLPGQQQRFDVCGCRSRRRSKARMVNDTRS